MSDPAAHPDARKVFQPHHRWDRAYHLLWLVLAWLALIAGFGPGSVAHLTGARAADPPVVDVHAMVFSCWIALVSVQIGLVRVKRPKMHVQLGVLGVALALAVVVSGIEVATTMSRLAFEKSRDPHSLQPLFRYFVDMAVFATFFALALANRRRPAAHKRLAVLATTFLLGAAFSRILGPLVGPVEHFPPALQVIAYFTVAYAGIDVLMALAIGYDLLTRGRVHPANAWGVPIILVCELAVAVVVTRVPAWSATAHWLLYPS